MVSLQQFPQQPIIVSGGEQGRGVFTVQCIAVEDVNVSVVQGFDYKENKGENCCGV
ncbi:hypothetical protein CEV32_3553 [Brucella rhizosphaerae]|uniref:Uncharacterized protein n=1 Tax=Brucella rhizosphaerae TaxID=571254 RepID=A0A256FSL4_9HYPH|nr:hypothetical protein CEV32_3553 [Brucella rhizosphaerae]